MTTVYVNHNLGIVLTDSRSTSIEECSFMEKIFHKLFRTSPACYFEVVPQKALFFADRILACSGDVSEIDKYLNHLFFKTAFVRDKKTNFSMLLVGASWVLKIWSFHEEKVHKKLFPIGQQGIGMFGIGSGSTYLNSIIWGTPEKPISSFTEEYVISEFAKCTTKDKFSDTNVNLFRFKDL